MTDATLDKHLDAVFSLLPPPKAREAKQRLLKQYRKSGSVPADELPWADFDTARRFIRAGISSVFAMTTRIVTNQQQDEEIAKIARVAADLDASPGLLVWEETQDCLYWFVPVLPSSADEMPDMRLRGFKINEDLFASLVHLFNETSELTSSEVRVIFQTLGGTPLRRAADFDAVSYETKRAHIKRACEKLNCSGHKDAVRKVLGQMVHLVSVSDAQTVDNEILETFIGDYLSNDFRLGIQRLSSGSLIRHLESGPHDGVPLVMVHGIMFPNALHGISRHLETCGLRLIVPIRRGFFETASLSGRSLMQDETVKSVDEIALFIKEYVKRPCAVIGHSLGAPMAARLVRDHPALASTLILLSANLVSEVQTPQNLAGNFYGGLRAVANEDQLFKLINWQYRQYYAQDSICRAILRRLFKASRMDIAVLDGQFTDAPHYTLFSETYKHSLPGIAESFGFVARTRDDYAAPFPVPTLSMHGSEDPLTTPDELTSSILINDNHRLAIINGGGHFISISHGAQVWKAVRDWIGD